MALTSRLISCSRYIFAVALPWPLSLLHCHRSRTQATRKPLSGKECGGPHSSHERPQAVTVDSSDPEPVLWPHPTTEGPGGVTLPPAGRQTTTDAWWTALMRTAELSRTAGQGSPQCKTELPFNLILAPIFFRGESLSSVARTPLHTR